MGHRNGTVIVDVTVPGTPVIVGNVPGNASLWREVKVYQDIDRRRWPPPHVCLHLHRSTGRWAADHRSHQPAHQRVAREHADRVQHLAHPVHLERRLLVDDGPCRPAGLSVYRGLECCRGAIRIYDLVNPVNPALVTPSPAGAGYMHDSTSMLITDNRTTQCAQCAQPVRGAGRLQRAVGRSMGRHGQGSAGAPVHDYLSDRHVTRTRAGRTRTTASSSCTTSWMRCSCQRCNTHIYTLDIGDLRAPFSLVTSYTRRAPPAPITTATRSATATTWRTTSAAW